MNARYRIVDRSGVTRIVFGELVTRYEGGGDVIFTIYGDCLPVGRWEYLGK